METALQAAGIIFREGLEAMLVLMALATYLVKSGHGARENILWAGAGAALVASLGAAWVFHAFYGGHHNDAVEGVVMALAACVMLYVSGWMYLRQDPAVWQAMLKRHIDKVMGTGSLLTLATVAFLAVFREGAETVLMLNALAMKGDTTGMLEGAAAGTAALAVLFVAMRWFAVKIPLRPFFLVTSAFLFVMGLHLAVEAVGEFQEVGWMTLTPWLGESFTIETATVLAFLLFLAFGGTALGRYQTLKSNA